ncbi:MAG: NAD-dependent deacylase [Chitinophagia bacterium]|nr:NAD-dependent deacylase [Chitinophagia bacterium]
MPTTDHLKKLVVLTGAGISAESGIKTFRDSDGLWEEYDIMEVAHINGWKKHPELVLQFYNMRRKQIKAAQPNAAHIGLVELEKEWDVHIITQNIDDLHERAGSKQVMHLHGEIVKMRSEKNEELIVLATDEIELGQTASDGAQFRPHIVWFGEQVPMIPFAIQLVEKADVLVIIGTSLQVYPAASLFEYAAPGIPVIIIDKQIPSNEALAASIVIEQSAGVGVKMLKEKLKQYL